MAEEVPIQGSPRLGKLRNPLGVVGLTQDMAAIGEGRGTEECGTSPGTPLLAVTLGAIVIVPAFVSIHKTCARLTATERVTSTPQGMEAGLLFLLFVLIGPVGHYIFQSNLNKVLRQQA